MDIPTWFSAPPWPTKALQQADAMADIVQPHLAPTTSHNTSFQRYMP